uniref:Uncharacterized protein n=1 Tax=Rhipicephalus microplus TaxID=6941 RepID=A0A6M2CV59_RHIMP
MHSKYSKPTKNFLLTNDRRRSKITCTKPIYQPLADLNMARLVVTEIAAGGRYLSARARVITLKKSRSGGKKERKRAQGNERGASNVFSLPLPSLPA